MIGRLLLVGLFVIGMVNGQFLDKEVKEAIRFYRDTLVQGCLEEAYAERIRQNYRLPRVRTCAACLKREFALYDPIYQGLLIKIKPAIGSRTHLDIPTEEERICVKYGLTA